jgi:hypothetical protein
MITEQIHDKFKLFTGKLEADKTLGALASKVEAWVREAKVAPKSIGVEYLEDSDLLVLSVGYRGDEAPYEIKLNSLNLGKLAGYGDAELARLEKAMGEASAKFRDIICHELYVTEEKDLLMVVMTYQR